MCSLPSIERHHRDLTSGEPSAPRDAAAHPRTLHTDTRPVKQPPGCLVCLNTHTLHLQNEQPHVTTTSVNFKSLSFSSHHKQNSTRSQGSQSLPCLRGSRPQSVTESTSSRDLAKIPVRGPFQRLFITIGPGAAHFLRRQLPSETGQVNPQAWPTPSLARAGSSHTARHGNVTRHIGSLHSAVLVLNCSSLDKEGGRLLR